MPHQLLEGGQGDSIPDHIRPERMSKAVRVGPGDFAAQAVMAEKRAESGYRQRVAPVWAFQRNEQSMRVGYWPFQ
jgi:hypothetical protein